MKILRNPFISRNIDLKTKMVGVETTTDPATNQDPLKRRIQDYWRKSSILSKLGKWIPETSNVLPIEATLISPLFLFVYVSILNIILNPFLSIYDRAIAIIFIEAFANLFRCPLIVYFALKSND
jgi:hypothetical protein